jgi:hypothetical protein
MSRAALLAAYCVLGTPYPGLGADPAKPAGDGWIELLEAGADSPWKTVDPKWVTATTVALAPDRPTRLKATPGDGPIWVNGDGRLPDLITKQSFKDVEVHVEFLIAKRSNSGIKFHAVYEIQILDSHGKKDADLTGDDCGGIYPRAELKPKYHHLDKGVPPKVNAARPAGEWQTLEVAYRSPRFNDKGEKTENAKIVKAVLNGKVIHENQELKTPTGSNWSKKETPDGPFMLQADPGPVAFRNVRIRELKDQK